MRLAQHGAGLAVMAGLAVVGFGSQAESPPLEYRVERVSGRLRRLAPLPEARIEAGTQLAAGASLATGWWSSAQLSVPAAATRFEIGPRTRVRLAEDRPGLLLVVEKGRVHGFFGPLSGSDPRDRLVVTPTALLAVRGTEYGVAVDASGETRVVVFEGTVEVVDLETAFAPLQVHAGEQTAIRQGSPPAPPVRHELSPLGWDRGAMPGTKPGGSPEHGGRTDANAGSAGAGVGHPDRPAPGPGPGSPGHGG